MSWPSSSSERGCRALAREPSPSGGQRRRFRRSRTTYSTSRPSVRQRGERRESMSPRSCAPSCGAFTRLSRIVPRLRLATMSSSTSVRLSERSSVGLSLRQPSTIGHRMRRGLTRAELRVECCWQMSRNGIRRCRWRPLCSGSTRRHRTRTCRRTQEMASGAA